MAHELDFSKGRAAIALVGGKAWHGYGQTPDDVNSIDSWLQAAGLDWECLVVPSQYEFGGKLLTSNAFHMVRSDTGNSLGVMSERYKPVQPREVLDFFQNFIKADSRFTMETAGALKGGKVIWALAKFADEIEAGGDKHVAYTLLTTSFDGKLATTAQATMIRVVCNNTLTASIWSKDAANVKVRHCTRWSDEVVAKAHDQLAQVAAEFGQYKRLADAMVNVRMTKDNTEDFLRLVFFGDKAKEPDFEASTNAKNQLAALFDAYHDTVKEGTEVGTAWTALNAVTRFVDHGRTTRDHSGEGEAASRMSSAFFGSGAQLKARAVEQLVQYANDADPDFARLLEAPVEITESQKAADSDFDALMAKPAKIKGKVAA